MSHPYLIIGLPKKMTETANNSPKPLSFPDAIAYTQSLMEEITAQTVSEAEIQERVSKLVSTQNGARGFFVAYLTSDLPLADNPSIRIVEALKTAPDIISSLLVKNVAMSAAMALTHRRNNDETAAKGSDRVTRRSINLIQKLEMKSIETELVALQNSLNSEAGNYQEFLSRWNYDSEQKQEMIRAISQLDRI